VFPNHFIPAAHLVRTLKLIAHWGRGVWGVWNNRPGNTGNPGVLRWKRCVLSHLSIKILYICGGIIRLNLYIKETESSNNIIL
jgi:hypothetical protein